MVAVEVIDVWAYDFHAADIGGAVAESTQAIHVRRVCWNARTFVAGVTGLRAVVCCDRPPTE
jgi:hypothetical protein